LIHNPARPVRALLFALGGARRLNLLHGQWLEHRPYFFDDKASHGQHARQHNAANPAKHLGGVPDLLELCNVSFDFANVTLLLGHRILVLIQLGVNGPKRFLDFRELLPNKPSVKTSVPAVTWGRRLDGRGNACFLVLLFASA